MAIYFVRIVISQKKPLASRARFGTIQSNLVMVHGAEERAVKHVPKECRDTQCAAHGVAALHRRAALGRRMEIVRSFGTFQPFNLSTLHKGPFR